MKSEIYNCVVVVCHADVIIECADVILVAANLRKVLDSSDCRNLVFALVSLFQRTI